MKLIPRGKYTEILKLIPLAAVALFIVNSGRCLIIKRAEEPSKGEWYLPGGRIFKGETIKDASLRIAGRECGVQCDFLEVLSAYDYSSPVSQFNTSIHSVDIVCFLVSESDKIKLDCTSSEYLWTDKPRLHLSKHLLPVLGKIEGLL